MYWDPSRRWQANPHPGLSLHSYLGLGLMSARLAILGGAEGKPGKWNAILRALLAQQAWGVLWEWSPLSPSASADPWPGFRAALPAGRTRGAQKGRV